MFILYDIFSPIDWALLIILALAVIIDQRERRIPNTLIIVGLLLGFSLNTYNQGFPGLLSSLQGLVAGIALLFIPFALKGMGAGDVKLLGMVGAFKGPLFAFQSFVFMAVWGGLIAVILLTIQGQLWKTLRHLWTGMLLHVFKVRRLQETVETVKSGICFPYALAIALGAVSAYMIKW